MTKDELYIGLSEEVRLIKKEGDKDKAFLPISVDYDEDKVLIYGTWYNLSTNQFIGEPSPERETIEITNNDLYFWSFYE